MCWSLQGGNNSLMKSCWLYSTEASHLYWQISSIKCLTCKSLCKNGGHGHLCYLVKTCKTWTGRLWIMTILALLTIWMLQWTKGLCCSGTWTNFIFWWTTCWSVRKRKTVLVFTSILQFLPLDFPQRAGDWGPGNLQCGWSRISADHEKFSNI